MAVEWRWIHLHYLQFNACCSITIQSSRIPVGRYMQERSKPLSRPTSSNQKKLYSIKPKVINSIIILPMVSVISKYNYSASFACDVRNCYAFCKWGFSCSLPSYWLVRRRLGVATCNYIIADNHALCSLHIWHLPNQSTKWTTHLNSVFFNGNTTHNHLQF